jgi:hypothetical protein
MATRNKEYNEEAERVAERLYHKYGKTIEDRRTFEQNYSRLVNIADLSDKHKKFMNEVYGHYIKSHTNVAILEKLETRQEKEAFVQFTRTSKRNLEVLAIIKNTKTGREQVVYAERVNIVHKERKVNPVQIQYRDRLGRWASIKR